MQILALTDAVFESATKKVVGREAELLSFPPYDVGKVKATDLENYDFLYLDLHGEPGDGFLWAARFKALSVDRVREADLANTIVFATTCFLPQTPFLSAFLAAGATAVVGGGGENWGGKRCPIGAQALAKHLIHRLRKGEVPERSGVGEDAPLEVALDRAKRRLKFDVLSRIIYRKAVNDALQFEIWR